MFICLFIYIYTCIDQLDLNPRLDSTCSMVLFELKFLKSDCWLLARAHLDRSSLLFWFWLSVMANMFTYCYCVHQAQAHQNRGVVLFSHHETYKTFKWSGAVEEKITSCSQKVAIFHPPWGHFAQIDLSCEPEESFLLLKSARGSGDHREVMIPVVDDIK